MVLSLHVVQDGKGQAVEDVLAAANALLDNLSAGKALPQNSIQASIDELSEMGYVCDESGCVLVLPGDKARVAGMQLSHTAVQQIQDPPIRMLHVQHF